MQSFDLIETYAYGTNKDLVSEKVEIKCNSIINDTKMINFDEDNSNWPQILGHLYKK